MNEEFESAQWKPQTSKIEEIQEKEDDLIEQRDFQAHPFYQLFFLYIEPISALAGSFYAGRPQEYLSMLTLGQSRLPIPDSTASTQVNIALYQLSNLYLLFAVNEHLVLKHSHTLDTWRALLFGLLIADFGHLVTNISLGTDVYWKFWEWNAMMWGGVGFVYAGALTRILFLLGVGVSPAPLKED
jgi:hypothetical protein